METTELSKSGIQVSRLCIGTWQATGWESSDSDAFVNVIRHGISAGLNFIDTAEAYGNGFSEQVVAKAVKGCRDKVIIASKFTHSNSQPEKLRKALVSTLRNLKTDYLDLYQQHWPPKSPPLQETMYELEKFKAEGKIRAIGVSNWMQPEWDEVEDISMIDTLQPCYSLLWRSIEKEVLPLCRENNISVLPSSPLCQGLLARKMERTPEDHRKKNIVFQKQFEPVWKTLEEIAAANNKTVAQVSLRWLLDQDGISAPIVGCSSKEQMEENIGALDWNLDSISLEKLDRITKPLSEGIEPHDTLWGWHPRRR